MRRAAKGLALMLIISVSLSGCSSFSKEGRRQAAVRHQLRKVQKERARSLAKATEEANRPLRDPVTVSEPTQTITLEPLESDAVANPIVVSDGAPPSP